MSADEVDLFRIGGVGDVFLNRQDAGAAFEPLRELLKGFDLLFGNCEGAFTDRQITAPSAGLRVASETRNALALAPAGFDMMSLANNHAVDAGWEGLADTIDVLRSQAIGVAGAAKGNIPLLVFGLIVSIPLVVVGSKLILKLIERFPLIIVAGGGLLGWIAGELIATDPVTKAWFDGFGRFTHYVSAAIGAALVIAVGKWLTARAEQRKASTA